MRSSTIAALAILAATATPSLAVPISSATYERRGNPSQDESDALSLGTISTIAGFAAPVVNGIIDHFKGKRDPEESGALRYLPGHPTTLPPLHIGVPIINARELEDLMARADVDPESGAFLGAIVRPLIGAIGGLLGHKREFDELMARADVDPESGAFLGAIARLIPTAVSAIGNLINKREFEELMARADVDPESGAFLGAIVRPLIGAIGGLLGHKREFGELMARADIDPESGAILGALPSVISAIGNLINKREFEELMARADVDPESGAFLGAIARLIPTAVSAIGNLINKREVDELFARVAAEVDESGAVSLTNLANVGSLVSSGVSVLHNLFSGNKRDFEELLARYESPVARSLYDLD